MARVQALILTITFASISEGMEGGMDSHCHERFAVADRTCVVTADRRIVCWPLPSPSSETIPFQLELSDPSMIASLALSDTHLCILSANGGVSCSLFSGLVVNSGATGAVSYFDGPWLHEPSEVAARQICVGSFFTCSILAGDDDFIGAAGTVRCWGSRENGAAVGNVLVSADMQVTPLQGDVRAPAPAIQEDGGWAGHGGGGQGGGGGSGGRRRQDCGWLG